MEADDVCILECLSNDLVIPSDGKQPHRFSAELDAFVRVSREPVTPASSPPDIDALAFLPQLWLLLAASGWKTVKFNQCINRKDRKRH